MIKKLAVLLRVKNLQQCGGWISLIGSTHLVDFVEHDDWVGDFDVFQSLHQLAGHSSDIGPSMAFDFGLISHAAQAKAVKLAPERIGNGTTDAGFAHPWGPTSNSIDPSTVPLNEPTARNSIMRLFDVIESVVVCVQRLARLNKIEIIPRKKTPQGTEVIQSR